eukprot:CAMPEP_0198137400 /NCGR_PEP_ID=MMETSP1443-20131203/887_1 /TAXON_ID=186043 /ORGANISM="Entomoneis sp., Strain CCMP2396" /LENGTH=414 /DNA_ID=CAMNT_0043798805 /DNA_START=33 /DNA_END=1274 /DNA_ORIENTATION=-
MTAQMNILLVSALDRAEHLRSITGAPILLSVVAVSILLCLDYRRRSMSNRYNNDEERTCLVIGGGLAGLAACSNLRSLDKRVKIILVEPKEYFECIWSSYRSIFDEKTADRSLFDLEAFCKAYRVQHVKQKVSKLKATSAVLGNGENIEFNVAFVGVGAETSCQSLGLNSNSLKQQKTDWAAVKDDGYTMMARKAQMKSEGDKLVKSPSVVIIGGGIVGCELAGDLVNVKKNLQKQQQQGKNANSLINSNVTLIHSGPYLCNRELGPKASQMVHSDLEKAGVKIILNERANIVSEKKIVQLQSSERTTLDADEVVMTVGVSPANSFMDRSWLDEKGWIQVDDSFCVVGISAAGRIFAAGDCCTLLPNSGSQVLHNAHIFARNLYLALNYHSKQQQQQQRENGRTNASSSSMKLW